MFTTKYKALLIMALMLTGTSSAFSASYMMRSETSIPAKKVAVEGRDYSLLGSIANKCVEGSDAWLTNASLYALLKTKDVTAINNACTTGVTSLNNMLSSTGTYSLALDLSKWDVSNVTDMSWTFATNSSSGYNYNHGDISLWDTRNVTNMDYTFHHGRLPSTFNIDKWNVSSVTSMISTFGHTDYTGTLKFWDVGNVTNMTSFLSYNYVSPDISRWDTKNVTKMDSMFYQAFKFNVDISGWNVDKVIMSTTNKKYFNAYGKLPSEYWPKFK